MGPPQRSFNEPRRLAPCLGVVVLSSLFFIFLFHLLFLLLFFLYLLTVVDFLMDFVALLLILILLRSSRLPSTNVIYFLYLRCRLVGPFVG